MKTVIKKEKCDTFAGTLKWALRTGLVMFALYTAFKCAGGFDLGETLYAACCTPFYVAYRLAVPCAKAAKVVS